MQYASLSHQAWYLDLRRGHGGGRGEDLYPLLREKMDDAAVFDEDRVRFEVMRHFGYFVTESTHHMSEYVPWFRTTPDLIEAFTTPRWDYYDICVNRRDPHEERMARQASGQEHVETARTKPPRTA